jgi:hypothetical protein
MKLKHAILLGAAGAAGGYQLYKRLGRGAPPAQTDFEVERFEHGEDRGHGNLLAVQPVLAPADFASPANLEAKLAAMLDPAKEHGLLTAKTIAVFPEHIGTWLLVAREKRAVFRARSLDQALVHVVGPNFIRVFRGLLKPQGRDPFTAALFAAKGAQMAADYHEVFSRLSGRYACTMVAGSILLPAPEVTAGRVLAGKGPLVNVAAVYGSDGKAKPQLARKCFPSLDEPYLSPGDTGALTTYTLPAGRLGVVVGRDAFEPDVYRRYRQLGVDLLANPAQAAGVSAWTARWSGYPDRVPADVDPRDIGALAESAAWMKYGLAGRARMVEAKGALSSMLLGQLWDRAFDGAASGALEGTPVVAPAVETASLYSLWL